ncbi:MAG: DUF4465 domain-containing protein [Phycisphaerae bacterium]|nr:DUF4465 domain-containing protein [Phycisphaerae bacterium]
MQCTSLRPGWAPVELWICVLTLLLAGASNAAIATFDELALPPESHWNGADGSGGFTSGEVHFENHYNADWDSWDGFAYSNRTDPNLADWQAQYNAIPGCGQSGSANYGIVFVGWETLPTLTLTTPQVLSGLYVTNNNYTYYDMLHGSAFSKKFGGPTGDDQDWLKLTIIGLDAAGQATGTVDFYLADLRFADNAKDYILRSWAFVNLTSLGEVKTLQFNLDSSDKGPFGLNTPTYACIDTIVPQPPIATFDDLALPPESCWNGVDGTGGFTSGNVHFENRYNAEWEFWDGFAYSSRTDPNLAGLQAQYNAIPGCGQGGSANYGVVFVGWETLPTLTVATPQVLSGLYVTNNNYTYYDMLHGSAFSKKFGGPTGNDQDWLKLIITGLDAAGQATGRVDFYLADFRFAENTQDYILNSWAFVNLTSLGEVKSLQFNLDSSDKGAFGPNTPTYLCIDTIVPCQPFQGE